MKTNNEKWIKKLIKDNCYNSKVNCDVKEISEVISSAIKEAVEADRKKFIKDIISQEKIALIKSLPVEKKEENELIEKLADIEHQRWADWMGYLFGKCDYPKIGENAVIPAEWADRWGKQMNTPYSELTEKEKDSDREQVMRYFPLINQSKLLEWQKDKLKEEGER